MLIGMGNDPSIGEYERLLLSTKTTARKELILLHPERSVVHGSTREWLKVHLQRTSSTSISMFHRFDLGFTAISMSNCQ